jgi:hypothetical protein
MVDLSRELQPLLDHPPAEPEPVDQLEALVRRRRRRRRVTLALALAPVVAAVVSVGMMWSERDDQSQFAATGPSTVGPTQPIVVATGEINGHPWRLQAYLNDGQQCLDMLAGGRACFDPFNQHVVGVAVDFTVSEDATGTARTSVAAVYGPVHRDVARIALRLTSGEVIETPPVGQDAGFAVNFYVAHAPTEIPAASELSEVIVYDATGQQLDRLEPDCAPDLGGGPAGPAPLTVQIHALGPCE